MRGWWGEHRLDLAKLEHEGRVYTLGVNAAFHDPAACLVEDGMVIAAAEEERFTHIKHGKRPIPFSTWELPFHAIDYCLREAGIVLTDVDHVAYSFDPFLLLDGKAAGQTIALPLEPSAGPPGGWESPWDPLFLASIVNAPRHLSGGAPHHLAARFAGARFDGPYRWHFVPHHLAHAASAFLPSPFVEAGVLTLDGRGERATTSFAIGRGTDIEMLGEVEMPHSLGLLYERVTEHLGFLHSSDEYKVMALASFGEPRYVETLLEAITVRVGGGYTIAPLPLDRLFGAPRAPKSALEQRHFDIARSLQDALEEIVLDLVGWLRRQTDAPNLAIAGGVGLNCVLNSRIAQDGGFDRIWVQPAAGDAGTALGAALLVDLQESGSSMRSYRMEHAYLGPAFGDREIERFLRWSKLRYRRMHNVAAEVADLLVDDRVVGWFQGRMEFGPRALGARSILASPLHEGMRDRLNDIKDREDFRPVAPVVTREAAGDWFDGAEESPFMLFVYDVLPGRSDSIPAARHVDGTARIQTVTATQNPLLHDLLTAFEQRTGVPVLINTSFNTRGEPIVCTPRDAIESFWTSPLDALAIGAFLLEKPALR